MSFYKKFLLHKLIPSTLILSILFPLFFFGSPKKADAWFFLTLDAANLATSIERTIKEYVADTLANMVAKTILRKLTAQTVNWINSGFKGNPAFITNPGDFFLQIGDTVAADFLSTTAFNRLCSPFQAQVRISLARNYLQEDPFGYTCTLDEVVTNYDNFMGNFTEGGWESWFQITQNSQNNPYGAYQAAQNELSIRMNNQQDRYQKQLQWGSGFLSYERCKPGTEKPVTEFDYNIDQEVDTGRVDCTPENKETVTPGKVIDDQLSNALGSSWKQLEAADEINEIVSALVVQLTEKIIGGAVSGLRGLTSGSSQTNNRAFIEQLANQSPETLAEDAERIRTIQEDANRVVDNVEQATNDAANDPNTNTPLGPSGVFPTEPQP